MMMRVDGELFATFGSLVGVRKGQGLPGEDAACPSFL